MSLITKRFSRHHAPSGLLRVFVLVGAASALSTGCHRVDEIQPTSEVTPGASTSPTPADAEVPKDAEREESMAVAACPTGLPGPDMVMLTTPSGASYCMDRTEVTQAQYTGFLKAKGTGLRGYPAGDLSGQPDVCKHNEKWVPDSVVDNAHCEGVLVAYDPDGGYSDYPVACVDWCDAHGYCAWAGKRLCGSVGGGAGAVDGYDDAAKSEWFFACSQGGKTAYPYGDTFDPDRCAVQSGDAGTARPNASVSASAGCRGTEPPFDSILGLSGNVGEWEDACEMFNDSRLCLVRSMGQDEQFARCDSRHRTSQGERSVGGGIRCCADPK